MKHKYQEYQKYRHMYNDAASVFGFETLYTYKPAKKEKPWPAGVTPQSMYAKYIPAQPKQLEGEE